MKRVFVFAFLFFIIFYSSFFAADFSQIDMNAYFAYINKNRQNVFEKTNKALFKVVINLEKIERNVKCSELFDPLFCRGRDKKEYKAQIEKRIEALAIAIDVTVEDKNEAFFVIFNPLAELNKDIDVVIDDSTYKCSFLGYDETTGISLYKVLNEQKNVFYEKVKPLQMAKEFKSGEYVFVTERECPCREEEKIYVKDLGGYANTSVDCASDFLSFFFNQRGELVGVSTGKSMFADFYVRNLNYSMVQGTSTSDIYGVIPVDEIKKVVVELMKDGVVKRSCAGFTLFSVNKKLSEEKGLKVEYGCYVDAVTFGSDFVIKPGDVIVSMNGYKVKDFGTFCSVFRKCKNNDLKITLYRDGNKIDDVIIDAGVNADVPFVYEKGNKLTIEGISFVEATSKDGITSSVMISTVDNEKLTKSFEWEKNNNFVVKRVNNHSVCSLSELKKVFLNSFKEFSNKDMNVPLTFIGSFSGKDSNEKIFSLLLAKRK